MAISTLLSYWWCADWQHSQTRLFYPTPSSSHFVYFTLSLISECRAMAHPAEFPKSMRISVFSLHVCCKPCWCPQALAQGSNDISGKTKKIKIQSGPEPGPLLWTSQSSQEQKNEEEHSPANSFTPQKRDALWKETGERKRKEKSKFCCFPKRLRFPWELKNTLITYCRA